jgi:hypothetical protein
MWIDQFATYIKELRELNSGQTKNITTKTAQRPGPINNFGIIELEPLYVQLMKEVLESDLPANEWS